MQGIKCTNFWTRKVEHNTKYYAQEYLSAKGNDEIMVDSFYANSSCGCGVDTGGPCDFSPPPGCDVSPVSCDVGSTSCNCGV